MTSIELYINSKGGITYSDKKENRITKKALYNDYLQFCINNEIKKLGSTTFHNHFQRMYKVSTIKGIVMVKDTKQQRECYVGIKIDCAKN